MTLNINRRAARQILVGLCVAFLVWAIAPIVVREWAGGAGRRARHGVGQWELSKAYVVFITIAFATVMDVIERSIAAVRLREEGRAGSSAFWSPDAGGQLWDVPIWLFGTIVAIGTIVLVAIVW